MKKTRKINEIFYSLQGEGAHAGEAAVFIRFSGCNLACPFCDTDFQSGVMMSDEEIVSRVNTYAGNLIVLTGGEPSLFIDKAFVSLLKATGKKVAIETNGTHPLPPNIDWITISPKTTLFPDAYSSGPTRCQELKVIFTEDTRLEDYTSYQADYYFLQPCYSSRPEEYRKRLQLAIDTIKQNPKWRLSIQLHKVIGIR